MMSFEEARTNILKQFDDAPMSTLFSQVTVAAVCKWSNAKLERDRWAGGGIPYLKLGRSVRYRKSDVLAWLARFQPIVSTSAKAVPPVLANLNAEVQQ